MLNFALIALVAASSGPDPCTDNATELKATFSVTGSGTPLFQVLSGEGVSHACIRLGSCHWSSPIAAEQSAAIDQFSKASTGPDETQCAAVSLSTRNDPPYESVIRTTCDASVRGVRTLNAVREFVEDLGSRDCTSQTSTTNQAGDVLLTATLTVEGEPVCLGATWSPSTGSASVSLGQTCDPPLSAANARDRLSIYSRRSTHQVGWELEERGSWQVIAAAESGADYAAAWARSVGEAANVPLHLPRLDPLGAPDSTRGQDTILVLSRWAMAAAAPRDSYLDTVLREWMASVQLLNPSDTAHTVFRHECIEHSAMKSCSR